MKSFYYRSLLPYKHYSIHVFNTIYAHHMRAGASSLPSCCAALANSFFGEHKEENTKSKRYRL